MLSRYILDLEAALWRVQPAPQADWCFWRESQRCGENIQVRMALASDAWSYFNDLRREKLAGVLQLQRVTALWLSSCDKCRREHSGAGRGGWLRWARMWWCSRRRICLRAMTSL